jgi:hypothetical protein
MGFIKDNANTFEVYLTELGQQAYFNGGLKDNIAYFSLSDSDSNYQIFEPNVNEILPFDAAVTYSYGDVVSYLSNYYVYKNATSSVGEIPASNPTYWETKVTYNPTVITAQPIATINHAGTNKTSLGNGLPSDDDYIDSVFTQAPLRGKVSDNIDYSRALFGVNTNTQRDYVLYEPDLNISSNSGILIYIKV